MTREQALKEIWNGEIKVKVQDGKIVSIPVQDIEAPEKFPGVRKIIKITKPITIGGE